MKNLILISSLLLSVFTLTAQNGLLASNTLFPEYSSSPDRVTLPESDKKINFPGGYGVLEELLQSNLVYPALAVEQGIEGTVNLRLALNEQGQLESVNVLDGIGAGCDKEAIRIAQLLPNWEPAVRQGKAVAAIVVLQIQFGLQ